MPRTPAKPGAHIEYSVDRVNQTDAVTFVTTHPSRTAALEAAVDAGNKVVFARHGETLAESVAREQAEKQAKPATRTPAARPVRDEPQA